MNDWFRSWHGAPTDQKWLAIAKRAKVAPGFVVAVVWSLMDRASQHADRGSIAGYDAEAMAVFLGCEEEHVLGIVQALHEKGVLERDRFASWEKRQPKREREDNSTSRVQEHRARQAVGDVLANSQPVATIETPCNTMERRETPREEEIRVESIGSSLRSEPRPTRKRGRTEYPSDFEEFWKSYPTDPNMSKSEAFDVWKRLEPEDRELAIKAVPQFVAYCKSKPDYRPVHANRFLAKRRFDGFAAVADKGPAYDAGLQKVFVARDSADWRAWVEHTNNNGGRGFPVIQRGARDGWWFATARPPLSAHQEEGRAA